MGGIGKTKICVGYTQEEPQWRLWAQMRQKGSEPRPGSLPLVAPDPHTNQLLRESSLHTLQTPGVPMATVKRSSQAPGQAGQREMGQGRDL